MNPFSVKIPVPLHELDKFHSNGITGLPYSNGFEHSAIPQLFQDNRHIELHRSFVVVRFDATHEPGIAPRHKHI